jgi:hypothetical protein
VSFVVAVLRCGQCVVGRWRTDGLNARESIGDDVILFRDVSYVGSEMCCEVEMIELLW